MRIRALALAPALLAALSFARPSLADVPPQDSCQGAAVGSSCDNAGPGFDQEGVCTKETCRSGNPLDDGGTYPCQLCELSPDGSAPACPDGGCPDASVPANACAIETLGESCKNAGPNADEPGVCEIGPCDNGNTCSLCQLPEGGTTATDAGHSTSKDAGHATSNDAGHTTAKDAGRSTSSGDAGASQLQGSGCSTSGNEGRNEGGFTFALGLGMVGLAFARRRKAAGRR